MSQAGDLQREQARRHLAGLMSEINTALGDWHRQALSQIEAWDGTGEPPISFALTILQEIRAREEAIAAAL